MASLKKHGTEIARLEKIEDESNLLSHEQWARTQLSLRSDGVVLRKICWRSKDGELSSTGWKHKAKVKKGSDKLTVFALHILKKQRFGWTALYISPLVKPAIEEVSKWPIARAFVVEEAPAGEPLH